MALNDNNRNHDHDEKVSYGSGYYLCSCYNGYYNAVTIFSQFLEMYTLQLSAQKYFNGLE